MEIQSHKNVIPGCCHRGKTDKTQFNDDES